MSRAKCRRVRFRVRSDSATSPRELANSRPRTRQLHREAAQPAIGCTSWKASTGARASLPSRRRTRSLRSGPDAGRLRCPLRDVPSRRLGVPASPSPAHRRGAGVPATMGPRRPSGSRRTPAGDAIQPSEPLAPSAHGVSREPAEQPDGCRAPLCALGGHRRPRSSRERRHRRGGTQPVVRRASIDRHRQPASRGIRQAVSLVAPGTREQGSAARSRSYVARYRIEAEAIAKAGRRCPSLANCSGARSWAAGPLRCTPWWPGHDVHRMRRSVAGEGRFRTSVRCLQDCPLDSAGLLREAREHDRD